MGHIDHHNFSYHSVRLSPRQQIVLHSQDTWELSAVTTGAGMRLIGDISERFTAGEVVLIPPGIPHCWYFEENSTDTSGCIANITLTFAPQFLSACERDFTELRTLMSQIAEIGEALKFKREEADKIIAILRAMNSKDDADRFSSVIRLLNIVAHCHDPLHVGKRQDIDRRAERMSQIDIFVSCNAHRAMSIDEVARYVGMNRSAFCTFFKKATGTTFISYLNRYRIRQACKLLAAADGSISDICYRSGFNNVPYFNRLFKHIMGIAPSGYTEKIKKDEGKLEMPKDIDNLATKL